MKCKARTKTCRNCKHRYTKEEYELWNCPECNEPRRCEQAVVKGYEVCNKHGAGYPLKGRPGGTHKGKMLGKYSSILEGTNYLEAYETSLEDNRQLELKHKLAISEARYQELLRKTQTVDSHQAWKELDKTFSRIEKLYDDICANYQYPENMAEFVRQDKLFEKHREVIEKGLGDWAIWAEREKEAEHYRKLSESERKLYETAQKMVAMDKVMGFLQAMLVDIQELVPDPETRSALGYRMQQRLSGQQIRHEETVIDVSQLVDITSPS